MMVCAMSKFSRMSRYVEISDPKEKMHKVPNLEGMDEVQPSEHWRSNIEGQYIISRCKIVQNLHG